MPIQVNRFTAEQATPLQANGASGVNHTPVSETAYVRVTALYFGPKGELGRRELPYPVLLMVLEGSGTLRLGGEIREVMAGDSVLLPANTLHMLWANGAPMTALTVEYPAGEG